MCARFERYFRDKPFPCAICGLAVIYDDKKKQTECGCKKPVKCEISKEDMRRHALQGVFWIKSVDSSDAY